MGQEKDRMIRGELYYAADPELIADRLLSPVEVQALLNTRESLT